MNKRRGSRFGRFGVLVVVLGVLAAACGSGGDTSAAKATVKAPAGAKENATSYTGTAVCRDVKSGATTGCAVNTVGPGGGLVFYDAGSQQSWGRFLEVAPWNWNPAMPTGVASWDCAGGCGADTTSVFKPQVNKTQDRKREGNDGYVLCLLRTSPHLDLSTAANTGEGIGDGRANTASLLADPACQRDSNIANAVALVHAYRGGGLSDWYLPSKDELTTLCDSAGRNYVGGFNANEWYASSSTVSSDWTAWRVGFDNCGTDTERAATPNYASFYSVRPIRAFS
jgi:hypothetical protein